MDFGLCTCFFYGFGRKSILLDCLERITLRSSFIILICDNTMLRFFYIIGLVVGFSLGTNAQEDSLSTSG